MRAYVVLRWRTTAFFAPASRIAATGMKSR